MALELVMTNDGRVAVSVPSVDVYPSGLVLRVALLGRDAARPGIETGPGTWRFGVGLADGRKATSFGIGGISALLSSGGDTRVTGTRAVAVNPREPPEEPALRPLAGAGSRTSWTQLYWLWPLPASGDLLLACEWPNAGLDLTTATIDGDSLREAALRAQELWPPGEVRWPSSGRSGASP